MEKSKVHGEVLLENVLLLIQDFLMQHGFTDTLISFIQESRSAAKLWLRDPSDEINAVQHFIFSGEWQKVELLLEPLRKYLDSDKFRNIVFRCRLQRFLEALDREDLSGTETHSKSFIGTVRTLQEVVSSEEEFHDLMLLLTVKDIRHIERFKKWTVSSGRIDCFNSIVPLFVEVLSRATTIDIMDQEYERTEICPNILFKLVSQAMLYQVNEYESQNPGYTRADHLVFNPLKEQYQPTQREKVFHANRGLKYNAVGNISTKKRSSSFSLEGTHFGTWRAEEQDLNLTTVNSCEIAEATVKFVALKDTFNEKKLERIAPTTSVTVPKSYWGEESALERTEHDFYPSLSAEGSEIAQGMNHHGHTRPVEEVNDADSMHVSLPLRDITSLAGPAITGSSNVDSGCESEVNESEDESEDESDDASGDEILPRHEEISVVEGQTSKASSPIRSPRKTQLTKEPRKFTIIREDILQTEEENGYSEDTKEGQMLASRNIRGGGSDALSFHADEEEGVIMPSSEDLQVATRYSQLTMEALTNYSVIAENEESQAIRTIGFDSTGCKLAVGSNSRSLRLFDTTSVLSQTSLKQFATQNKSFSSQVQVQLLRTLAERRKHHTGSVYCLDWNYTNTLVATGSNDKSVKIISCRETPQVAFNDEVRTMKGHRGTVRSVCFPREQCTASYLSSCGSGDNLIRLWDLDERCDGDALMTLDGHTGAVLCMKSLKLGTELVTGGEDQTIRFWDIRSGCCEKVISNGVNSAIQSISVSPVSDNAIATGHSDGSCAIWDIRKGKAVDNSQYHHAECRSTEFSPDGKWILTGSFDGKICIFNCQKGGLKPVSAFHQHSDKVLQAKWHPKYPIFASSGADKLVKLWVSTTPLY